MKIINILATLLLSIILISTLSSIAIAGIPPVPPTPTPVPSGGGGSSGGGGGGGSSTPAFQPHTDDLKSSNGTVIGTLEIKDYFTVVVSASNNTTVDNQTYSFAIRSGLGSEPEGAVMDIDMGYQNSTSLPVGMNDAATLACANVTRFGKYGWSLKEGSVTVSFTMPASALGNQSNASQLYIVRYDGAGYQILPASVSNSSDGTVTLSATVPSDYGVFSAVLAAPKKPEPVATATPTPTPTPAVTPMPTPAPAEDKGIFGWLTGLFG